MLPPRINYSSILDLILISQFLNYSLVIHLPPIAGSDHFTQFVCTVIKSSYMQPLFENFITKIDFSLLQHLLNCLDWAVNYLGANSADNYFAIFTNHLQRCIKISSFKRRLKRFGTLDLPKFIVKLIYGKSI